jgi:hypothetical protein
MKPSKATRANSRTDQGMETIIAWVSPLAPHKRHQDIRQKRLEGTGGWFLEKHEYQQWCDGTTSNEGFSPLLVCPGIPGAGKSVIWYVEDLVLQTRMSLIPSKNYSSLVVDNLINRFSMDRTICAAYLYCDYRDMKQQTPVNMIGGLVKQVLSKFNELNFVPDDIFSALRDRRKRGTELDLDEVCQFLVQAVEHFCAFYICIDALYECKEEFRAILLQCLSKVLTNRASQPDSTRIFVTGRPLINREQYIKRHMNLGYYVHIALVANANDISQYIAHEIDKDDNNVCMNDALREEMMEKIIRYSDGMLVIFPYPHSNNQT